MWEPVLEQVSFEVKVGLLKDQLWAHWSSSSSMTTSVNSAHCKEVDADDILQ